MTPHEEEEEFWRCWKACAIVIGFAMLLLLVTVSFAEARSYVAQPPAKYDRLPVNYEIRHVHPYVIQLRCRSLKAIACAGVPKDPLGKCIILLPYKHPLMSQLLTHEFGHCNGWPASHPNPRRP